MQFSITALTLALAATLSSVSAVTPPAAGDPSGNPIIHPGLGELIPAGQTYTITWTPTTPGDVSLLLLRGPSTNVVPILTIADTIPNTGSYAWNVPDTLAPDTSYYGIQLIVEGTGQYQYSPQCGVSNPGYSSTFTGAQSTVTLLPATYTGQPPFASSYVTYTSGSAYASGTGAANYSIPVLSPTGSMTVPFSLLTTTAPTTTFPTNLATKTFEASTSAPPAATTNAAVANYVRNGGAAMAAVAGVVALVL